MHFTQQDQLNQYTISFEKRNCQVGHVCHRIFVAFLISHYPATMLGRILLPLHPRYLHHQHQRQQHHHLPPHQPAEEAQGTSTTITTATITNTTTTATTITTTTTSTTIAQHHTTTTRTAT